ncbi:hypothetical protein C0992_008489 [Termitomyces sp. T32_za158]|nr:hypothetical protein C0992_008489 [Termitomyces sp. T32_za158]
MAARETNSRHTYVWAVQTAMPDNDGVNSGNEPDVEDDEMKNLVGSIPQDNVASDLDECLGDEFAEVDIYDNDYYAQESNTEFMGPLTDYLASEFNRPIGAGNVKVYKVHLHKAPGKLARPVL